LDAEIGYVMSEVVYGAIALIAVYVIRNMMRSKRMILNPDGTYSEGLLNSKKDRFEDGDDVFLVEPACVYRRMVGGIIPQSRAIYLRGSSRPVGFHSGKPVSNERDLKLRVGSSEIRTLMREKVTAKIGQVPKKFDMKIVIYAAIAIGALVVAYVVISKLTGGSSAAPSLGLI
jgi:hypothetical protein